MEIRIEWSWLAEKQLRSIYDYFYVKVSHTTAKGITNKIVRKVSILEKNPFVGNREELLQEHPEGFRYLFSTQRCGG